MPQRTDSFDLERLGLRAGEGRRLDLAVATGDLEFAGQAYDVAPDPLEARLDISRTTHNGHALRLRFSATVSGPCMRCLSPAAPRYDVDAREVNQPGGGDELASPYVDEAGELDLAGWARDALALALPDQILCRAECLGLCPECGVDLNEAGAEHHHERPPDPRWAKLRELKLD